jgi:glycosyltransferase involved in cell wall biosynthesis
MPIVDIVVPNYQYGRYLRECISSILDQGVSDLRILIIDNASTDDSVDIARQLAAKDSRIEVRARPQNLGFQASVNEGIDWATSEYFMVVCADDLLPTGALSRAIEIMEKHPEVSFAYGKYAQYRQGDDYPTIQRSTNAEWRIRTGADYIKRCCCEGMDATMSPLVRTRIHKKVGHYRPELQFTDDMEVLLRLAYFGSVAETGDIQAIQRLHEMNVSQTTWKDPVRRLLEQVAVADSFFRNEGRDVPEAKSLHAAARRGTGAAAYWAGVAQFLRGDYRTGFNLLKLAVHLSPRSAIIPPLNHLARIDQPLTRFTRIVFRGRLG